MQVSMPRLTRMVLRLLFDESRLLEKKRAAQKSFLILPLTVPDPAAALWTREILDQMVKSRGRKKKMGPL